MSVAVGSLSGPELTDSVKGVAGKATRCTTGKSVLMEARGRPKILSFSAEMVFGDAMDGSSIIQTQLRIPVGMFGLGKSRKT